MTLGMIFNVVGNNYKGKNTRKGPARWLKWDKDAILQVRPFKAKKTRNCCEKYKNFRQISIFSFKSMALIEKKIYVKEK